MIYISKPWLTNKSYIIKLMSSLITLVIHINGWEMIFQKGQYICYFKWVKGVSQLLTKFLTLLAGSSGWCPGELVTDQLSWMSSSRFDAYVLVTLFDDMLARGLNSKLLFSLTACPTKAIKSPVYSTIWLLRNKRRRKSNDPPH